MNEIHTVQTKPMINCLGTIKLELVETRRLLERIQQDFCCIKLREKIDQMIKEIAALEKAIE